MKSLLTLFALTFSLSAVSFAEPVNTKCPVTGKDANPKCKTTYEGKEVAFCSGDCQKKFKADPKKYSGKLPK